MLAKAMVKLFFRFCAIVLLFSFHSLSVHSESEILINIASGVVRGSTLKTRQGAKIFAFHGIRYAEPPIGANRFRPPVPAKSWDGVYNATLEHVACHQMNPAPSYNLSEDCLMLDVYTKNTTAKGPVIVFIHGGGFGVGAKSDISPIYLLERNVVLVSINYRLHALGFLSFGTAELPGNNGFKDQVLALKWVQKNIHAFGGDPNLVTLSGHSAGSFSVSLHMLSTMSKGLFHRVILMSGSSTSQIKSASRHNSEQLLKRTDCNQKNLTLAIECLRKLPVEDISKNAVISNECSMQLWNYAIEANQSEESFITEDPTVSLLEEGVPNIPILAGISADEFSYLAYGLLKNPTLLERISKDFSKYAPQCFLYDGYPKKKEISKAFEEFYLKGNSLTSENVNLLGDLYSDSIIVFGAYRFLSIASLSKNIYFYRFDFLGRYSHFYKPDGTPLGVSHGDELQYIYVFKKIAPVLSEDDPENIIIERMISWWARFAETGNPNDPIDEHIKNINWIPAHRDSLQTLYINVTSNVGPAPNLQRYSLWNSAFPLPDGGKTSIFSTA